MEKCLLCDQLFLEKETFLGIISIQKKQRNNLIKQRNILLKSRNIFLKQRKSLIKIITNKSE